jgi:hypothetical protein
VQRERVWQTGHGNQVAAMTDSWSSTNGAAHTLSATYDEALWGSENGGEYEFPGTGGFVTSAAGQIEGLPAGPGAIYYKEDAKAEGPTHPVGAIVYDRTPSESLSFVYGSDEPKSSRDSEFQMPYRATVPASGGYTLAMTYVQGSGLTEVQALVNEALTGYQPPTVTIASPKSGTTVTSGGVTVSGTAANAVGTPSLTVNGHAVSVGTGGAWSTSVALNPGANTITAVASNQLGLTSESSIAVTYAKPRPKPRPPTTAPRAHQLGVASGANGAVSFTVSCSGVRGTSCVVAATVSTVERNRHGRPVAVAARYGRPVAVAARHRRHRPVSRSIRLTVGSATVTIPAGRQVKVTVALNAVGRTLLARFGYLPVHLTAYQVSGRNRRRFVAENLVVVTAGHRHHGHRHRRRHHHR